MNKFIIGIVIGILLSGALAYYLNNMQVVNRPVNMNQTAIANHNNVSNADHILILAPDTKIHPMNGNASDTLNNQNAADADYDFYEVLQGKKVTAKLTTNHNSKEKIATLGSMYIQLGSFVDSNQANELKVKLALLGISGQIRMQMHGNEVHNSILVGPYNNQNDAQNTLQVLANNKIYGKIVTSNDH